MGRGEAPKEGNVSLHSNAKRSRPNSVGLFGYIDERGGRIFPVRIEYYTLAIRTRIRKPTLNIFEYLKLTKCFGTTYYLATVQSTKQSITNYMRTSQSELVLAQKEAQIITSATTTKV